MRVLWWRWRAAWCAAWLAAAPCCVCIPAAAASLSFTLATSEAVLVTGTPRIAIDVGGVTRYATYVAGSGTGSLTFSYAVQPQDFDADGIMLVSPLDLNGGVITDLAGNPVTSLAISPPATPALKVQTYTVAFATNPITSTNAGSISFTIAKAPTGASFSYSIGSSAGTGTVNGNGTISGVSHTVSNVDVSGLAAGTLTLSVTITFAGTAGEPSSATATPSYAGALDGLPANLTALSVRRLRAAYAGPLLRVRRSTDNAEQDVGATVGGNLDTFALGSFCAAATCSVTTWYDQSGNGANVSQPNAALQPVLVTAGAMETEGGRPALRFSVVGQCMDTAAPVAQTLAATINVIVRNGDSSVNRHPIGDRGIGVPVSGRQIRALAGGASYIGSNIGGASVSLSGSSLQQRVITILSSAAGVSGALDGAATTGGTSTYFLTSPFNFRIGGGGQGQGTCDWIGTISEAMLFNVTLGTTARQMLERNQGGYYGISVQ